MCSLGEPLGITQFAIAAEPAFRDIRRGTREARSGGLAIATTPVTGDRQW
jgi:hypothetical protein